MKIIDEIERQAIGLLYAAYDCEDHAVAAGLRDIALRLLTMAAELRSALD